MSTSPSTSTPSTDIEHPAELPCEPDDVPVRFLLIVATVVTIITLALIGIGVWLFNVEAAAQMAAKGYPVPEAPAQ